MARIFTIQFFFSGALHYALVSVRNNPFFTEYLLTMLDDAVENALPNRRIICTAKDSLQFMDAPAGNDVFLMRAILNALQLHLHPAHA